MFRTLLFLAAIALVQARPDEDGVHVVPVQSVNVDDCETLANGCPVDFTIHKLLPHEEYCHLFYYCDKGELVLRSCPEPLYFDPKLQVCVWSWQTDCVNNGPYTYPTTAAPEVEATTAPGNDDIGEVLDNGCPADFYVHRLLPHEECEKFYQCNFGKKIERDCAPGTVFHYEIQVCDWPRNVPRCAGSAGATTRPQTTPAASSEEIPIPNDPEQWESLPNGCPADFSIHHLLPHETDCDKYYACSNGRLIQMGCGAGTHFSPSLQVCTWPHEAGCEHWTGGGGCTTPGDNGGNCGASTTEPAKPTTAAPAQLTTPAPVTIITPAPVNSTTSAPVNPTTSTLANITTPTPVNITTPAPVNPTTAAPVNITTPTPVNATTSAPVNPTTSTPANITTPTPVNITTPAPVNPTTAAPVNITTPTPVNATTSAPVNITTPAPVNATTPAPVTITTSAPVNATTAVPNNSTTTVADIEPTTATEAVQVPTTTTTTKAPEAQTTTTTTRAPEETPTTAAPDCATEGPVTSNPITEGPTQDPNSSEEVPAPADPESTVTTTSAPTSTPSCPTCPTVPLTPVEKCQQGCNVVPWAHAECDKYYSCIGNEYRLNICSEGLHFNPRTLTCDFICNAGCVRNIPQVTRHEDGMLMFVPHSFNNRASMMHLIEQELNGEL